MIESVEYIGFVATVFILASFVMDGTKLRVVNSVGAALWFLYGIFTNGYSIMFLNLCVILIHIFKLWKSSKKSITNQSPTIERD
jgi:hypothetical protein